MALKKVTTDSDKSINSHLKTINELHQQLDQAKRNSDPEQIKKLGQIISEKQEEIEDLRRQLREKPLEVQAVRVVEKVVEKPILLDPAEAANRVSGILAAALTISQAEIEACQDSLRKNPILEKLKALQERIPALLKYLEPIRTCEDCIHCTLEGLDDDDKAAGYIYCKRELPEYPQILHNQPCENFARR
jgi:uncharacterized protein with von Willebrand factor type A (vWA) domain